MQLARETEPGATTGRRPERDYGPARRPRPPRSKRLARTALPAALLVAAIAAAGGGYRRARSCP
jgi:hypothetical protein